MRVLIVAALTFATAARSQPPVRARPIGVPVIGTVYDSLARLPLALASVQLVSAESATAIPQTAIADSLGRFSFPDVARGRYIIGFFHPLLDSLTLQPILRELFVPGNLVVRADLATPSGTRLRGAFCAERATRGSPAAVVGIIRDARDGTPVEGASVVGQWTDLVLEGRRMLRRPAIVRTKSGSNGWFALCGVPSPGTVSLSANRGADSTDLIDLQVPADGFARREVQLGGAREGNLSGRVLTGRDQPLEGAVVSMPGGPRARTNAAGEWTLSDVPFGTRVIEVRALSYYPERRAIDITRDPPSVVFRLVTLQSVLDTVRIRAKMPEQVWSGFEERRTASGSGRFITEDDIRRRAPVVTSELLKYVPGMRLEADEIRMRGAFSNLGEMGDCTPTLYLDGKPLPMPVPDKPMRVDDIDMWVRPSEIRGIEIYPDAPPPQFQLAQSGCGSIVIWTKRPVARR